MSNNYLCNLKEIALENTSEAVDRLVSLLSESMTFKESREVDYALGYINSEEGMEKIKYYLFNGTQIQRNYCALYFGRIHQYKVLREAYDLGLIDEIQAFSR